MTGRDVMVTIFVVVFVAIVVLGIDTSMQAACQEKGGELARWSGRGLCLSPDGRVLR